MASPNDGMSDILSTVETNDGPFSPGQPMTLATLQAREYEQKLRYAVENNSQFKDAYDLGVSDAKEGMASSAATSGGALTDLSGVMSRLEAVHKDVADMRTEMRTGFTPVKDALESYLQKSDAGSLGFSA
jgi:hypothetical protein